jgi:hypothetical protein
MLANEALYSMLTLALFSTPLMLVWMAGAGAAVALMAKSRAAGSCLLAAALLELFRLGTQIALVPMPVILLESGTLGSDGLRWFGLIRAFVSVGMIVVSHILLLLAIFGWRR